MKMGDCLGQAARVLISSTSRVAAQKSLQIVQKFRSFFVLKRFENS